MGPNKMCYCANDATHVVCPGAENRRFWRSFHHRTHNTRTRRTSLFFRIGNACLLAHPVYVWHRPLRLTTRYIVRKYNNEIVRIVRDACVYAYVCIRVFVYNNVRYYVPYRYDDDATVIGHTTYVRGGS